MSVGVAGTTVAEGEAVAVGDGAAVAVAVGEKVAVGGGVNVAALVAVAALVGEAAGDGGAAVADDTTCATSASTSVNGVAEGRPTPASPEVRSAHPVRLMTSPRSTATSRARTLFCIISLNYLLGVGGINVSR
jgi:hypothetical protein